MTAPAFGDLVAIDQYVGKLDHVYEVWELARRHDCPPDQREEYRLAAYALAEADAEENQDKLIEASELVGRAEDRLRNWGRSRGWQVNDEGLLEGVEPPATIVTWEVQR